MPETPVNEGVVIPVVAKEESDFAITAEDGDLLFGLIRQMADFLQDPLRFAASVRQRFNPLSPAWHDVLEMLPRDAILGQQDSNWYWSYDFFGNPQPPPVRATVAVAQPVVVSGSLGTTVQDAREAIRRIREIDSDVLQYTEQRLGLDQLAIELRLLEVSPDFATFEHAAGSYLANVGAGPEEAQYASLATDRLVLQQYYDLLNRCWLNVKWTFFIAAAIGIESNQAATDTRMRTRAIRLVARNLDFALLTTDELQVVLSGFTRDLEDVDPQAEHYRKVYGELMAYPLDGRWFEAMALRMQIEPALWDPANINTAVPGYFKSRFKALILHLRNGKPLQRVTLTDLCTLLHTPVPEFHGDPNAMTLPAYAETLLQANWAPLPSLGFTCACAIKLGFGQQVRNMNLSGVVPQQEDVMDLQEAAERVIRSGERVLLILGKRPAEPAAGSSLAQTWTISQRHAVFPVYAEYSFHPELSKLDFSLVLFEETPEQTISAWRQMGIIREGAKQAEIAQSGAGKSGLVIVQPKDLDDAVAQALRPAAPPLAPA